MDSQSEIYPQIQLEAAEDEHLYHEEEDVEGDVIRGGVEGESTMYVDKFIPQAPEELKPKLGKEFCSEDAAYDFYNAYARFCGFSIRKCTSRKLKSGEVSMRVLSCSKEGARDRKHLEKVDRKLKPRMLTRCNCPALLKVNKPKDSNTWVITKFEEVHSHKLMTPNKSHCLRSHRSVPNTHLDVVAGLGEVGIGVARSLDFFSNEAGGRDFLGYEERDLRNALARKRFDKFGKSAKLLLEHFQRKSDDDMNFSYQLQLDDDGRMTSCFWVDSTSKLDYEAFNDVVCFDTTYKTNEFDMPFGPFVGLNHHKQSILLGAGLLFGETIEDFKWLFNIWLKAMSGKPPKVIITDQDPAIIAAIADVFPTTKHHLCMWHISQKLPERLGDVFNKYKSFHDTWNECIYDSKEIEEFEARWSKMIDDYKELRENKWLQHMWDIRSMWIPAYTRSTFCAGMTTTGRSESVNAMFDYFVNQKTKLVDFATGYERALDKRRHAELKADCETKNGTPVLLTAFDCEEQMSKIYTKDIFYEFQKNLTATMYFDAKLLEIEGPIERYLVSEGRVEGKMRTVVWDTMNKIAFCPCQSFQFCGIVCKHILAMFRAARIMHIPPSHILQRWTRSAKEGYRNHSSLTVANMENSPLLRRQVLSHSWTYILNQAASNIEAFKRTQVTIERLKEELIEDENMQKGLDVAKESEFPASVGQNETQNVQNKEQASQSGAFNSQSSYTNVLLDPNVVPHKGRSNKRLKPGRELVHEGRLCRGCNKVVVGHDKRNCPLYKDRGRGGGESIKD